MAVKKKMKEEVDSPHMSGVLRVFLLRHTHTHTQRLRSLRRADEEDKR